MFGLNEQRAVTQKWDSETTMSWWWHLNIVATCSTNGLQ